MSKKTKPYYKWLRVVLAGMSQREQQHAHKHPRTSGLLKSRFPNPENPITVDQARTLIHTELAYWEANTQCCPDDLKRDPVTGKYEGGRI